MTSKFLHVLDRLVINLISYYMTDLISDIDRSLNNIRLCLDETCSSNNRLATDEITELTNTFYEIYIEFWHQHIRLDTNFDQNETFQYYFRSIIEKSLTNFNELLLKKLNNSKTATECLNVIEEHLIQQDMQSNKCRLRSKDEIRLLINLIDDIFRLILPSDVNSLLTDCNCCSNGTKKSNCLQESSNVIRVFIYNIIVYTLLLPLIDRLTNPFFFLYNFICIGSSLGGISMDDFISQYEDKNEEDFYDQQSESQLLTLPNEFEEIDKSRINRNSLLYEAIEESKKELYIFSRMRISNANMSKHVKTTTPFIDYNIIFNVLEYDNDLDKQRILKKESCNKEIKQTIIKRTYQVKRRFREFLSLQQKLEKNHEHRQYLAKITNKPSNIQFHRGFIIDYLRPSKINENSTLVKFRKDCLEGFLQHISENKSINESKELCEFLGYKYKKLIEVKKLLNSSEQKLNEKTIKDKGNSKNFDFNLKNFKDIFKIILPSQTKYGQLSTKIDDVLVNDHVADKYSIMKIVTSNEDSHMVLDQKLEKWTNAIILDDDHNTQQTSLDLQMKLKLDSKHSTQLSKKMLSCLFVLLFQRHVIFHNYFVDRCSILFKNVFNKIWKTFSVSSILKYYLHYLHIKLSTIDAESINSYERFQILLKDKEPIELFSKYVQLMCLLLFRMENIVKLYLNGEITIELLKQWFRLDLNICGNDSQCMGDNHVSSALSKCTTNLFAEQFIETLHSTFEWLTKQSTNVTLSRSKHIQTSVKNENSVNINYHDCFPTLDEALDKCQIQDNRTLKKRINPTLVSQKRLPLNENNSFRNIKNCVRNKSTKSSDYFKEEREMLKCFKMNIVNSSAIEHLSQNKLVDIKKYTVIEPKYDFTSHRDEIIKLKTLYVQLLLDNQTLSLFEEIRFVLDVLNKRTTVESSPKHDNHTILEKIFSTYHNCFYMMYLVFEDIFVHNQLINFIDYKAYNQIFENYSLYNFKTDLESLNLKEIIEQAYLGRLECRTSKNISAMENDFVFFKPETDSKFNFPNDFAFSSFRKQRDEFYRLLKNYHENNWSSSIGSDRKLQNIFVSSIRYMLNMSKDVGNYYHLARLFVSQMIKSSQNEVDDNNKKVSTTKCDSNSASKIMSEQDKFKKLQDRFVKKPHNIDMHLTSNILDDSFNQKERFFRDFIYYLDSHSFNEQLKLILKNEIIKLTTTDVYCFGDSSLEDECDNNSFSHYLSHLNQLAKFLGFVCFYPMDTSINMERLNKNEKNDFFLKQTTLRSTSNNHLPILDIETYLLNSMENHILIIAVPWVVEFLMFIDQITLSMTYYENVIALLCLIYRYYLPNLSRLINQDNSQISYVRIFIQLYLEKLFLIKKFNVATHLHLLSEKMMNHSEVSNQMFHKITNSTSIDLKNNDFIYLDLHSEIFDMELIAEFFPHFSKMIIDQFRQFTNEIRKITPTSVSNKQGTLIRNEKFSTISIHPSSVIRSQVEESFLNIHSNSLKKCVHFLNDRISATCIKRIKCEIYPLVKNKHFELFLKSNPEFNRDETTELKKNIDLIVKLANTIRTECQEFVPNYSKEKIETIFPLIIVDDLDESVINFAIKMCLQHIKQRCLNWIDLNITNETIYSDIINFRRSQIITTTNDSSPSNDFQSFQLVSSVFQQYEEFVCQLRETLCDLNNLENVGNVECSKLISLMSNLKSIRNVSFLPSSNIKIIDMTTLDLAISVIAYKPMMLNDELLECFIQSWSEQSITFQRVICAKNLYMMSKSTSRISSWLKFESFLTKMLKSRLISFADIEEETFIILKQDWPTNVLNSFANLLNSLVDYAKRYDLITFDENGHSSNEILEWLSWFCTENNIH